MDVLGNTSTVLLWILIGTLVVGLGLLGWRFFGLSIFADSTTENKSNGRRKAGKLLAKEIELNYWFKLALVSFVGIVLSSFALGVIDILKVNEGSHNGHEHQAPMTQGTSTVPANELQSLQRDMLELRMMLEELQRSRGNGSGGNSMGMM